jgi:quinol monooxygenase YgiN
MAAVEPANGVVGPGASQASCGAGRRGRHSPADTRSFGARVTLGGPLVIAVMRTVTGRIVAAPVVAVLCAPAVGLGQALTVPADAAFTMVAYVETRAAADQAGRSALSAYRDATQQQAGSARVEIFAQTGRPGHFAIIETWPDQNAFDTRDAGPQRQLTSALEPIRVSGYDQRPYKTLSVAPAKGESKRGTAFVITHVDVAPNPQVPVLLARLAEASRKEPGNLRFDVVQHTMRANHFTVIEQWQTQAALDDHVAAAATRQYRDELQPLTGSPLDERVYAAIE